MVETDIPGEPLQHFGELVERTAVHAGVEELPLRVAFPIGRVEIVLDVEEPDACSTRHQQDGNFNQQKRRPADFQHDPADDRGKREVGPDHAAAFTLPGALLEEALRDRKDEKRTDREQDQRAAHDTIANLLVPRRGDILLHGHRIHITDAAPVKVASRRVMDRMAVLPLVERRQHQHAQHQSKPVIRLHVSEE